jgi:hypothetical protein
LLCKIEGELENSRKNDNEGTPQLVKRKESPQDSLQKDKALKGNSIPFVALLNTFY